MKFRVRHEIVLALFLIAVYAAQDFGQRIAILTPDAKPLSTAFAEKLSDALREKLRVVDPSAAESAAKSVKIEDPFNLTSDQAKLIGTVIGSDFFILIKAATQRRSSSARPNYFEAHAAIYLVNSRTGFLDHWTLISKNGDTAGDAEKLLLNSAGDAANALIQIIENAKLDLATAPEFEAFDPDSKAMRPAMPFKRIKPEYTQTAYLYDVTATIDAEVGIDANGDVKRIDIVRWAGFGLDEAVIAAIKQMNWRRGEKNGKPLPMSILLRYNFTKIEKE
ncbi:MAG: energy transducer TonB [Pyrinomonadaceae bacterium]